MNLAEEFQKLNTLISKANSTLEQAYSDYADFRAVDRLASQLTGHIFTNLRDTNETILTVRVACPCQPACAKLVSELLWHARQKGIVAS